MVTTQYDSDRSLATGKSLHRNHCVLDSSEEEEIPRLNCAREKWEDTLKPLQFAPEKSKGATKLKAFKTA